MVRLKEKQASPSAQEMEFQFHYGTIKRLTAVHLFARSAISIPLWYD